MLQSFSIVLNLPFDLHCHWNEQKSSGFFQTFFLNFFFFFGFFACRYTFKHLDKGRYVFRARSVSLAQIGSYTDYKFLVVYDPTFSWSTTILIVGGGSILTVFVIAVVAFYYRQWRKHNRLRSLNASTQNILMQMDETSSTTPQDEEAPSFYHAHDGREREAF